jgi:hypothetical protein
MPATSAKQKKFMDAAAHNPEFAKKAGIPVDVAQEFSKESKGKKFRKFGGGSRPDLQKVGKPKTDHGKMNLFKEGGAMKHSDMSMDKKVVKKAVGMHEKQLHGGKKSNMTKLAKGGSASSRADGCVSKGKTKGMMVKMKSGGKTC